jgi:hypothetical protein
MTDSTPNNDPAISDEVILWRRVHPEQLVFNSNLNEMRPTSQSFQNTSGSDGMSVNIASETTIEETLHGYEDHFIVSLEVGIVRSLNQGVIRKPLPDNPAHSEVTGKKTKSIKKRLSDASMWVVPPNTP